MKADDAEYFQQVLAATLGVYGTEATPMTFEVWFEALRDVPIRSVTAALSAHVRDPECGRFAPKPADVIRFVQALSPDGRPGQNEAWATAITASDERLTVVWTEETAQAWGEVAPLMDIGDHVAARMAFIESYIRIIKAARERSIPVRWVVSMGYDVAQRALAVGKAVESGKLSRDAVDPQLLSHEQAPAFDAVALIGGRVEVTPSCPEATRERLAKVMDAIRGVDAWTSMSQ